MPRLIHSSSRADAMVEGVNRVLVTRGVFGLTLRAIAEESRISSGSLLHHFGSRERVLIVAAGRTGRWLIKAIEDEAWEAGVAAFVPGDDDMVLLTRAWLGWCELWRSEPVLDQVVDGVRANELHALAAVHDLRLSRPDLDTLTALVEGLRSAVCAPRNPMPPSRARELLRIASSAALARAS
jgi:AcrR family transcriptional regulator